MITETLTIQKKSLNVPDETREFNRGLLQIVNLDETTSIARITLQPGWNWERDVKPIVQTESCQVGHIQYVISGRLMVKMDDGTQLELNPGDAASIPAGHNAWVPGSEPCVLIDFTGMKEYLK